MENRISRREFAKLAARGGILALLAYCAFKTVLRRPEPGKNINECQYPGRACSGCAASDGCKGKLQNFGKDS